MSAIRIRQASAPDSLRASDSPLEINQSTLAEGIDWSALFGRTAPVEIEIGCGKGLFLVAAAAAHPEVDWLGIDLASKPLRRAIDRVVKAGLTNVRFAKAPAEELLAQWVPSASVRGVHILYPDPWPKKRHHKRRLLGEQRGPRTVEGLARVIRKGGWLSAATDHTGYAEVIRAVIGASLAFREADEFRSRSLLPDAEAPLTEFERKYRRESRPCHRFSWRRV